MSKDYEAVCPPKDILSEYKKEVTCTEKGCDQTFNHSGRMRMHMVKVHGRIENEGDTSLLWRKRLKADQNIHYHCPGEGCYYGLGSERYFSSFKLLRQHYQKVHFEKRHVCDKCGYKFGLAPDLARHRKHCGQFFHCATCECRYATKPSLQSHCNRTGHKMPEDESSKNSPTPGANSTSKTTSESSIKVPAKKSEPVKQTAKLGPIPVLLLGVPVPVQPATQKLPPLRAKPIRKENHPGSNDLIGSATVAGEAGTPVRQNATIQTDIFGVKSLSVSGSFLSNSGASGKRSRPHSGTRWGSSVDVENKRSTTGMQTQVSLLKPKKLRRDHTVMATQTTGDYILQKAMKSADIPIHCKTVASQVTIHKAKSTGARRHNLCSSETQTFGSQTTKKRQKLFLDKGTGGPVLVDFASQVPLSGIQGEMSHVLAEQQTQTMSDTSACISTQTLQSYLENRQERSRLIPHVSTPPTVKSKSPRRKRSVGTGDTVSPAKRKKQASGKQKNKGLEPIVHFPSNPPPTGKKYRADQIDSFPLLPASHGTNISAGISGVSVPKSAARKPHNVPVCTSTATGTDSDMEFANNTPALCVEGHGAVQPVAGSHSTPAQTSADKLLGGFTADEADIPTIDSEVQTMSASEFNLLLESSGIFLDSEVGPVGSQVHVPSNSSGGVCQSLSMDTQTEDTYSFLQSVVGSTDTNTQTVTDFSFLEESHKSSDIDTQTVSGFDFLDLVMNNMETQTTQPVNDISDLYLSDIQTQTFGSDGYDNTSTAETQTSSLFGSPNSKQEAGTGADMRTKFLVDSGVGDNLLEDTDVNTASGQTQTQTHYDLLCDLEETFSKVQSQSVVDSGTQTQKKSDLFDFETANTETQTTFEELGNILFA